MPYRAHVVAAAEVAEAETRGRERAAGALERAAGALEAAAVGSATPSSEAEIAALEASLTPPGSPPSTPPQAFESAGGHPAGGGGPLAFENLSFANQALAHLAEACRLTGLAQARGSAWTAERGGGDPAEAALLAAAARPPAAAPSRAPQRSRSPRRG